MKLVVVGAGQGGSNIADEFVALGKWVWKNRRIRIFTGTDEEPLSKGSVGGGPARSTPTEQSKQGGGATR